MRTRRLVLDMDDERPIMALPFGGAKLGKLVALIDDGTLSSRLAKEVFEAMFETGDDPAVIVERRGLEQIRDGLRPWRVHRLFCTQGFGQPRTGPDLVSVGGQEFDPLLGRTYAELGTEARSMHKCQGTSQLLPLPGLVGVVVLRGQHAQRQHRVLDPRRRPVEPLVRLERRDERAHVPDDEQLARTRLHQQVWNHARVRAADEQRGGTLTLLHELPVVLAETRKGLLPELPESGDQMVWHARKVMSRPFAGNRTVAIA